MNQRHYGGKKVIAVVILLWGFTENVVVTGAQTS